MENLTREEMTERQLAIDSLPNQQRYDKGDIKTHGKEPWCDVQNPRATIVTAKARCTTLRIVKLEQAGVITGDQFVACLRFRRYWEAAVIPYGAHIVDYNAIRLEGILTATTHGKLDDSLRYAYLCHEKQGIDAASNHILHAVVCHEVDPRRGLKGKNETRIPKMLVAMDKLIHAVQQLDDYESH